MIHLKIKTLALLMFTLCAITNVYSQILSPTPAPSATPIDETREEAATVDPAPIENRNIGGDVVPCSRTVTYPYEDFESGDRGPVKLVDYYCEFTRVARSQSSGLPIPGSSETVRYTETVYVYRYEPQDVIRYNLDPKNPNPGKKWHQEYRDSEARSVTTYAPDLAIGVIEHTTRTISHTGEVAYLVDRNAQNLQNAKISATINTSVSYDRSIEADGRAEIKIKTEGTYDERYNYVRATLKTKLEGQSNYEITPLGSLVFTGTNMNYSKKRVPDNVDVNAVPPLVEYDRTVTYKKGAIFDVFAEYNNYDENKQKRVILTLNNPRFTEVTVDGNVIANVAQKREVITDFRDNIEPGIIPD